MKEIGERLKKLREIKGLTQKQVAEAVGVSQQCLSLYEQGKGLKAAVLSKLADFFGVSMEYLFYGEDTKKTEIRETPEYYTMNFLLKEIIDLVVSMDKDELFALWRQLKKRKEEKIKNLLSKTKK